MAFFFISIVDKLQNKQAYEYGNWRVIIVNWVGKQYKISSLPY